MFYPLKFEPIFKDYIWGGRNLEKLGKHLPEGKVAESWELSCHPDGVSIIADGEFKGSTLIDVIKKYGENIIGKSLPHKHLLRFPLLVKLIDASEKLSVQVHPGENFAQLYENGDLGKCELWYIISAKPGAKIVYDVTPGTTLEGFASAINQGNLDSYLKYMDVFPGDVLDIPAGLVHAIGEGIMLAEIQQSSNITYRVYDYNRTDKDGNKRPLHVEKALAVIDLNSEERTEKCRGLEVKHGPNFSKSYKAANEYFSVELYCVNGIIEEKADGSRFYIFVFTDGECQLHYNDGCIKLKAGDTVFIPSAMGDYKMEGSFKALKSYVPDLNLNVIKPLKDAGYSEHEILHNVSGIRKYFK